MSKLDNSIKTHYPLCIVARIWCWMVEVLTVGWRGRIYNLVLVTMGQVVTCISTILYMAPYSIWCRMVEVLNVGWRGRIQPGDHVSGGDLLARYTLSRSRHPWNKWYNKIKYKHVCIDKEY